MRFLSLFAGIGGLDLGLERAGWTCVGQVEVDPFCRRVLAKHWPDVFQWGDIRLLDPEVIRARCGPIEALVGGFPCQDASVAGKGAGMAGHRTGLWREFHRLIVALRPLLVVCENVPGLRTRGADRVLDDLESAGYAAAPIVVGARHVGAPHRRDRVWIVGRRVADAAGRVSGGGESLTERGSEGRETPRGTGFGVGDPARLGERAADDEASALRGRWAREDARGSSPYGAPDVGHPDPAGLEGRSLRGCERADEQTAGTTGSAGSGMADPSRDPLRDEPGRGSGTSGTGATVARHDGAGLADSHSHGCEGERRGRLLDGERTASGHDVTRRHRWPARPGEPQHDWEEPRVLESGVGHATHGTARRLAGVKRRHQLKALGNSVVPACAEELAHAINAAEAAWRTPMIDPIEVVA